MAIKNEQWTIVATKKVGKKIAIPKRVKVVSLLWEKIWWMDKGSPFHSYVWVVKEEKLLLLEVEWICVPTKKRGKWTVDKKRVFLED
jgi:hypothetical protein